jgi:erythromycin esterase
MSMTRVTLLSAILVVAVPACAQQTASPQATDSLGLAPIDSESVVAWIAERALPVQSVTPGANQSDLQPLEALLEDVRVVGMGEPTHGTREAFEFKHRLFEFLVREMGFRALAFEASQSAAEHVVDPYVQGGAGDPEEVVASLGLIGAWEEVRDLVVWMRSYNQTVPEAERVHFAGIDVQYNDDARRVVLESLGHVAPERLAQTDSLFRVPVDSLVYVPFLSPLDTLGAQGALEWSAPALAGYRELYRFVEANRESFSERASENEVARLLRHARLLARFAHSYGYLSTRPDSTSLLRDRYMADHVQEIVNRTPGGRVAVWAHNLHVAADSSVWNAYPLGRLLREAYGLGYYAIAGALGGGTFVACDVRPESVPQLPLAAFEVGPRPEGSVGGLLSRAAERAGTDRFFLDLRGTPAPESASRWLGETQGLFFVGSVYSPEWGASYASYPTRLGDMYDGVVFLGATTAARPLPFGDCPEQIYR